MLYFIIAILATSNVVVAYMTSELAGKIKKLENEVFKNEG